VVPDFAVFKNFHIKERFQVEFRAEAFNLTNTPVFVRWHRAVEYAT